MKKAISLLLSLGMLLGSTTPSVCIAADDAAAAAPSFPHYSEFTTNEVPVVYIDSKDNIATGLVKSTGYIEASIAIADTDGTIIEDCGVMKVRGNSTAMVAKKPFTIKFNNKQNVLGMGKAKKWWLIASCLDPTFLRNDLALYLGRSIGLPYTSEHRYAELWLDGKYWGCYEIIEPVDTGKSRVNIRIEEEAPETEFLLQFELYRGDPAATYCKANGARFEIKAPDTPTPEQQEYIVSTLTDVISVMKTKNFEEIQKVVDVDSFAKYYLINEFFKNIDCGFSSMFFYYKDGKLYAGPPWDYDLTAGNLNYDESENSRICLDTSGLFADTPHFYALLFNCRDFKNLVRHIYAENYRYFESTYIKGGEMDDVIEKYYPVFMRNFDETNWDISKRYWHLTRTPDATYEENVAYLRNWLKERNEWLSGYYDIFGEDIYETGDVNGDYVRSSADAVSLLRYLVGAKDFNNAELLASDIDKNGTVDVYDMVLMRKLLIQK